MENTATPKQKMKWYHYLLGFLLVGFIVNLCSKSPKENETSTANASTPGTKTDSLSSSATEAPTSNWEYQEEVDKMTSKKKYLANIVSDNELNFEFPYNGGSHGSIMIRKKDGSTDIILRISKGQFMTDLDGVKVRLRFDDEPAFSVTGTQSSDNSSDLLFLSSESKIIDKLKKSKSLIVEAEFYNEGLRTLDFNIQGFEWKH